jgi:PAS domain S-box-containing protein
MVSARDGALDVRAEPIRRAAARQGFLVSLAITLSTLDQPASMEEAAARMLGERLGVGHAWLATLDHKTDRAVVERDYVAGGALSLRGQYRPEDFPSLVASLLKGGPVVANDVSFAPLTETERASAESFRIGSFIAIPVPSSGVMEAMLGVGEIGPRAWTVHEVRLLEATAARLWPEIVRARLEATLRASEDRQAFLLSLSDTLRNLVDPEEVKGAVLRELGQHLGATSAHYWEGSDASGEYAMSSQLYSVGPRPAPTRFRMDDLPPQVRQAYESGRTVVWDDTPAYLRSNDDRVRLRATREPMAAIGVPLLRAGKLVAVLGISAGSARRWTSPEIALVEDVAERTFGAVERARAEAALRASEQRYRSLFESIDEGVTSFEPVLDDSGRIVDWWLLESNPAGERLTGFGVLQGRRAGEIVTDLAPSLMRRLERVATTGEPDVIEQWFEPVDQWLEIRVSRVSAEGTPKLIAVYSDITARKRAESILRETEEREAFLLKLGDALRTEASPDAIGNLGVRLLAEHLRLEGCCLAEIDVATGNVQLPYGFVASGAPPLAAVVRFADFPSLRPMVGHTVVFDSIGDDPRLTDPERSRMAAGEFGAMIAATLRRGEQDPVWSMIAVSTRPRKWTQTEIALVEEVGERTWSKIERARARQRLLEHERALRREAERALRLREEFLAIVSHELRTPLAAILLWSRLLLSNKVPGREREAMETIERNAEAQRALVEDLLDTSRMMAGTVALALVTTEIGRVVEQVVASTRPSAVERGIELKLARDRAVHARVDEQRFGQIIRNVLDNALRYTSKGGQVTVTVVRDRKSAVVEVCDNGQGIPADLLPLVFDRFQRGPQSSEGGLGLGLAIAHDLVELHGGTIEARSEGRGQGSTFTVHIPALPRPRPPTTQMAGASNDSEADSAGLADKVVLLAEDDADTLAAVRIILEREGATVIAGSSGDEALQQLGPGRRPDIVVTDLIMPGMDGYALLDEIRVLGKRGDRRWRGVPVVALSAALLAETEGRSMAGFDAVLAKPVDPDHLVATIRRIVAGPQ